MIRHEAEGNNPITEPLNSFLTIIGQPKALGMAVKNRKSNRRLTRNWRHG